MHQLQASFLVISGLICSLTSTPAAMADGLIALRGARVETMGKAGAIDEAVILIRDGKIESIGTDVEIPVAAQVIDVYGKTIMPGIIDPYFVVNIGRNVQASQTRTVIFQGRVFRIGGGSPAIATTFAKIADGINLADIDWDPARRSGITTMHVVTGGYAQSMLAQTTSEAPKIIKPDGMLLTTVSNDTKSLDVLRNGVKDQRSGGNSGSASSRGRPSSSRGRPSGASSETSELWDAVKEGKSHVFVNVNNAAAILHTLAAVEPAEMTGKMPAAEMTGKMPAAEKTGKMPIPRKAKVAFIASGEDVYRTLDDLDPKTHTIVLAPRIDTIPNSRNRISVPRLLVDKKIPFAFSTSLGQSEFRAQQATPLLSVGMLVRSGLDRKLALEALTVNPAKLLGIDAEVGTLEVGKRANLLVLDDEPFSTTTGIQQIYIDGKPIHEN